MNPTTLTPIFFKSAAKVNQRALRYSVEDKIKEAIPLYTYTDGSELGNGRIESRTYNIYDGLELIADKEKWGGNLTVVEFAARTYIKSTGEETTETRLYLTNIPLDTPWLGDAVRFHWSIESMRWGLDVNLRVKTTLFKSFLIHHVPTVLTVQNLHYFATFANKDIYISIRGIQTNHSYLPTQTVNPHPHIRRMLRHNDVITFIQIRHGVFDCKVRNQKRQRKNGLIRMVTTYQRLLFIPQQNLSLFCRTTI